ncbi:sperm-associated antigen 1 [Diachasma alloeum]|uniref:sperm-associated antigen 1 n=1 Tax=Diachasma alloeum TaxID=454923 RepID=UPI0007383DFB|nr:sperm-associated antigen 1 [Diachasma alloeum]
MANGDVQLVTTVTSDKKRPLIEKYDIPIEKLSFEYITESHNTREIERMVLILRSGEEGYFPDLLRHAEDRLRKLKPMSQVLRCPQPILTPTMLNKEQQDELNNDMTQWMRQMHLRNKDLEDGKALHMTDNIDQPEIRKIPDRSKMRTGENPQNEKSMRIKSCDYSSWDKYDADTEVNRIDLKSEQELVKAKQLQQRMKEKKLAEKEALNKLTLTGTEITVLGEKEREKGNEAFRTGDYEEALQQYSLSLEIDSTINGYNNRAITYIKLEKFEEAIRDCDRVLSLDYTNVKALLRRASALESLGRREEALGDYSAALKLEPNNKSAIIGVGKLSIYNDCKKVRMTIEELDDNDQIIVHKPFPKSTRQDFVAPETKIQESKASRDELIKIKNHLNPIIEELKTPPKDKVLEAKSWKHEMKGVKFSETSKTARRLSNDICFCDRAPGSSTCVKPLPHRRAEYCLGVERYQVKKTQSTFTFSNSCYNYSKSSGVVIKEIPSEPCNKIPMKEENCKEKISKISDFFFNMNVNSPYEFICTWESLKGDSDLKLYAKLLRTLGSANLESIVGSKLNGNMLSTILQCLKRHFCRDEDSEFVYKFLNALTELQRFSIVSMFMDSRDREAVKNIIDFLEQQKVLFDTKSLGEHYNTTW